MVLDPDDRRSPYLQVSSHLRAAILTGIYGPGERLPSRSQLAELYGVANMTISRAIDILKEEKLVFSRQGSGVYVRERTTKAVGLRPHIEAAFEADTVSIDFAGFTGETLHGALIEPLDKVRTGRYAPEAIQIRAIVPDTEQPWGVPCTVEGLADDPAFRRRSRTNIERHALAMVDALDELQRLGLVASASAEVRTVAPVQLFKLYVINGQEVFFGFYPIDQIEIPIEGETHTVYDLTGKDTVLLHYQATENPDDPDTQHVAQSINWFDTVWTTVTRPLS
jgi:DNA-binding transcriptional regulator YhcF (GntR family)